jgi:hypothetical protein
MDEQNVNEVESTEEVSAPEEETPEVETAAE